MEITTQEYQDLNLRDVMHDLTMSGGKPTWSEEHKDNEQQRVMKPFRGKPEMITKDDVINLLEFGEKTARETAYAFAHGLINHKIAGTGGELDIHGVSSYKKALPIYYELWQQKKGVLESAKKDDDPEVVAGVLLNEASSRFTHANYVRTESVKKGYKTGFDRSDKKGSWLTDMWTFGTLGERAQQEMAWNFVAAAELYVDIMKVEKGLDFPLETNRDVYHR